MGFHPRIENGSIVKNFHGKVFVVQGVDYPCSGGSCGSSPLYFGTEVLEGGRLGEYAQGLMPTKLANDLADYLSIWSAG